MRRKITFIRHGKAVKASPDQSDLDRVLGEVGQQQASDRGLKLGWPTYDLVLSSPASRAIDTAAIVAGVPPDHVLDVDVLYPDPVNDPMGVEIDKFFNDPELGYAPVSKYLAKGGKVVVEHGALAWMTLQAMIHATDKTNILIGGHAVVLQAVGMAACIDYHVGYEILNDLNLGECEGFQLLLEADGRVASVGVIQ